MYNFCNFYTIYRMIKLETKLRQPLWGVGLGYDDFSFSCHGGFCLLPHQNFLYSQFDLIRHTKTKEMRRFVYETQCKTPFQKKREEWLYHNRQQFKMTEDRGVHAEKLIEQSDRLRDRTRELITKKKHETEWRFLERINDIEFVRIELEKVRKSIQEELEALDMIQERTEDEIKYVKTNASDIVQKCIHFRKGRTSVDLFHDEVDTELEKEIKKIKEGESLLQKTLEQIKETKRDLRASLYLLNRDVEGKLNCLKIETECLNMKETNSDLVIYEGKEDLDKANITLQEWDRYSDEIMQSSEKKIHEARLLQSHVKNILEEVVSDLREQYFVVNEAFKMKITEVKEAKERLESQHYEIVRQVNNMTLNINELKKSIQEKQGFLALAQTRLEKRSNRPGIELVKDEVEAALIKEILEIKHSVSQLQHMLAEAETTLKYLLKAQVKLEEEINIKTNSIKIDEVDCLTIRQMINYQSY